MAGCILRNHHLGPLNKHEFWRLVVFQAKFVTNANARGSDYKSPLLKACAAEARAIRQRVDQGLWAEPATYILVTNCSITAEDRIAVEAALSTCTLARVITLGAEDLAATIDLRPEIARAFPQILSYRNLLDIISKTLAKDVLERSEAALAGAQDIIPVFVPTEAYNRAWTVLRSKFFVVLSGPPEMGKTAIGWMIAMSQVANGWQVIECSTPDDVFKVYDSKEKQLFLSDDAFGRTEFSVDRGSLWESDLAKVLQRIDRDHLLVWTSRKHILERAIREIDLQGKAAQFPKPAEVLVQANKLSPKEKALILYRHAAHANLEEDAKEILRDNLDTIVEDPHFTPERIRRFVRTELPRLAEEKRRGSLAPEMVRIRVEKAIEQYTEMMQKSFAKLPEDRRWILACMLDEERANDAKQVERTFTKLSPVANSKPIEILLDELDEAFIKITKFPRALHDRYGAGRISWVHPSYRDLVIDFVSKDRPMRLQYLRKGGLPAIALALSQEGGATGQRLFPLLPDAESWAVLEEAAVSSILAEDARIEDILAIFNSALSGNSSDRDRLETTASVVCETARQKWDNNGGEIEVDELKQFYLLTELASRQVPSPDLTDTWEGYWGRTRDLLYGEPESMFNEPETFEQWAELLNLLQENEPRYLRRTGFPTASDEIMSKLIVRAAADAELDLSLNPRRIHR